MARKSLTLVWVGPRTINPPAASKKAVASLLSRYFWASAWRGPPSGSRIDHGAGGIGHLAFAAVDAVGIGGKGSDTCEAAERDGKRQRVFLTAPAAPLGVAHRDLQLAAAEDRDPATRRFGLLGQPGMGLRHLARLPRHAVAEIDHVIACQAGLARLRRRARRPAWR